MADQVTVDQLPLEQLDQLSRQLSQEVNVLRQSMAQLVGAQTRFNESMRAIKTIGSSEKGTPMLVPLTLSLYAPGKVSAPEYVTVDIGTGYFVKKTIPEAQAFVERKLKFLENNIGEMKKEIMSKRRDLETVVQVMQAKVQAGQKA